MFRRKKENEAKIASAILNPKNYVKCLEERGTLHVPVIIQDNEDAESLGIEIPEGVIFAPILRRGQSSLIKNKEGEIMAPPREKMQIVAVLHCLACKNILIWDTVMVVPKRWLNSDAKTQET
ncbi:hypothetical protein LCGC14_0175060 [marine sediment metagenome]|uniref:Uncharacterized protein n=1 Tax=marine sediment metagenome TaxID=412755 RepID=A0A0F9V7D9_9ZZZZ